MFHYKNNILHIENLDMTKIAEKYESPFYVYSKKIILDNINKLKKVFSPIKNTTFAFAVKVENNLSILKLMANEGFGADIVSSGELLRYIKAGGSPSKVMFSGVSKTEKEIEIALTQGIKMFNIESIDEAIRINKISERIGKNANCAIRVNPNVQSTTHKKITTGEEGNKFGISVNTIKENAAMLTSLKNIKINALAMHIGSQILSATPFYEAVLVMKDLMEELEKIGIEIKTLDLGGGFGIQYNKEKAGFDFDEYEKKVIPLLISLGVDIVVEPGRFITGSSAALVMKVEYVKKEWGKTFLLTNAGMNDYIRVAMYEAYNDILPLMKQGGENTYDIVGPICESSDYFAKDRRLCEVKGGQYLALIDAGGYGYSMSSNYNARPLLAQVLVDDETEKLIRKRQSFDDMIQNEISYL